jgi:hypothetical protein
VTDLVEKVEAVIADCQPLTILGEANAELMRVMVSRLLAVPQRDSYAVIYSVLPAMMNNLHQDRKTTVGDRPGQYV